MIEQFYAWYYWHPALAHFLAAALLMGTLWFFIAVALDVKPRSIRHQRDFWLGLSIAVLVASAGVLTYLSA